MHMIEMMIHNQNTHHKLTILQNLKYKVFCFRQKLPSVSAKLSVTHDRIPSTTPGAEPPRDARDSGSARSHSTHLENSSSDRP